jgi:O-acetyl-ADP-ribose deacetylase (regulator of RNase III)
VRSALEIASQLGVTSVSIPAISTGIFGYPKEEGVRVIVDESLKFFKENPNSSVREVRFVALDPLTANLFALALKARLKVL